MIYLFNIVFVYALQHEYVNNILLLISYYIILYSSNVLRNVHYVFIIMKCEYILVIANYQITHSRLIKD